MRADRIKTDKFEFEQLLECKGREAFNEHGYMLVRGIIKKEKEEEYFRLLQITAIDAEGRESNLFHGILYNACFRHENGVVLLQLHLKTGSYLADINRHIRSFQGENTEYGAIAKE